MSTKRNYNLSIVVATINELVKGEQKTHVDLSVYAIQIVQPRTQFTDLNHTVFGRSSTGNFSDSASSFILFGVDKSEEGDALRSLVYQSVCSLIGTTNGRRSMCVCIPNIKDLYTEYPGENADMTSFVEGIIAGLQDAMKDCTAVVKSNQHTIYFAVPDSMKEALAAALEKVE